MPSLLFLCTANRFRSPLAAAIFRNLLQQAGRADSWHVESAGTWTAPGLAVIPSARQAARRLGLDLQMHASAPVDALTLDEYDLILVMESGHKEALSSEFPSVRKRVYLLSEAVEGLAYDIPDPVLSREQAGEIAQELDGLLTRGFDQICSLAERLHSRRP